MLELGKHSIKQHKLISKIINKTKINQVYVIGKYIKETFKGLKPYKKAIDAGVYSIMGAHNELNGVPCHMNSWLMTDLFREQWGFQGFFVSDWMDIERIETLHHVANNLKEASYLAVNAGMDMHMHGVKFPEAVIELVQEGTLPIQRVNEACEKILTAKFKLGLFENRTVDLKAIPKKIFTQVK